MPLPKLPKAPAGGKDNPYGVDNNPFKGTPPSQKTPNRGPSTNVDINPPDPVGDFVRRITGGNREKKKSGY